MSECLIKSALLVCKTWIFSYAIKLQKLNTQLLLLGVKSSILNYCCQVSEAEHSITVARCQKLNIELLLLGFRSWIFNYCCWFAKVDNKNYSQHFNKHDEDKNYRFEIIFWNQNYERGAFLYKNPWPFSRQCQVFHFWTYPKFESLSLVFETIPTFPFSEQSSLS